MMDLMMQYLKYLLEGLAVAAAAYFIPKRKTSLNEVAMIALTAAATFAVLDLFAPAVGSGARHGAGFGIGARHVGFGAEGFKSKNVSDGEEAAEKFHHISRRRFLPPTPRRRRCLPPTSRRRS